MRVLQTGGESGPRQPECHLLSAFVGPFSRRSRILACLVLAALGIPFSANVPRVSPPDCFATCPSGDGELNFASTPSRPQDILIAPVLPTAGTWNRGVPGLLRLGGWKAPRALLTVLRLGSWLFGSDSSLFTHLNEDNLVLR